MCFNLFQMEFQTNHMIKNCRWVNTLIISGLIIIIIILWKFNRKTLSDKMKENSSSHLSNNPIKLLELIESSKNIYYFEDLHKYIELLNMIIWIDKDIDRINQLYESYIEHMSNKLLNNHIVTGIWIKEQINFLNIWIDKSNCLFNQINSSSNNFSQNDIWNRIKPMHMMMLRRFKCIDVRAKTIPNTELKEKLIHLQNELNSLVDIMKNLIHIIQ